MSPVVSREAHDRLREVRERKNDARDRKQHALKTIEVARAVGDEQAAVAGQRALEAADADLLVASELDSTLLRQMTGLGSSYGQESFLNDPSTLQALERMATSSVPIGRMELGPYLTREQAIGLTGKALAAEGRVDETPGMGRGPFGPIVPAPLPPTSFLDLVPSGPLDAPSLPYAQEISSGDRTAGAAPVAPAALKPAATISYADAEAKPETVAAWTKVNKQTLMDVQALQARIQTRLLAGVLAAIEAQVIGGDGTPPNLLGLLNTSGIAHVAHVAGTLGPDALLDGIVDVLAVGAKPNVIALSLPDWAALLKTKSAGSQEYLASPFLATAQSVWGVALVPAVGIPVGTALVGDTTIGIQVLWRESVHMVISDSDQDDVVRNRATLLAEARVASAMWVPAAFAIVDLT